ncbi:YCF48-related protein [Ferrimonas pelagia]|uniref:YCF48-related protein n=2 Tax=Ferrimonas pelagia TaxID=1177826 RepID=A0ABP9F8Z7_9GAMM
MDLSVGPSGLVAVGDRGHILRATQSGWEQQAVPVRSLLTAVSFAGEQGWAVGHDATILQTEDAGKTWQIADQRPELDKPLLDVLPLDGSTVLAVGAYGLMFRRDGQTGSWQEEFHDELLHEEDKAYLDELKLEDNVLYLDERGAILPHFNRIRRLRSGQLYLVGEMGFIARSDDLGRIWQMLPPFYDGSLYDVLETPSGSLIAMGLRGHLFRSEDGGEQWQEIDSGIDATVNQALLLADGRIAMVSNAGYLLISDDDGLSFRVIEVAKGKDLVAIAQTLDQRIAIAGSDGVAWIDIPQ